MDEFVRRLQRGLGGMFGGGGSGKRGGSTPIFVAIAIGLILWIGWPGSGWYIVQPQQQGIILRFGDFHRAERPGFHLKLPTPIERVLLPNVQELQSISIGGTNSSSTRRGQSVGSDNDSLMLTGDENIVDLSFTVQWVINTEKTEDFLFNIDNPDRTVLMVSEAAMREVIGQTELQPIISNDIEGIAQRVQAKIQETLDYYEAGINVTDVLIERPTLPEAEVASERGDPETDPLAAFRDVENAEQERQRSIEQARAYLNSVVPDARGRAQRIREDARAYREAVIAEAAGDAERFRLIYEQYRLAPEVTRQRMFLETMEMVLGNSQKVILDEDGNGSGSGVVPYLPLNELTRQRTAGGQ